MKQFQLVVLLLIIACSTKMDQEKLFSQMKGVYKLTKAGQEFITRDMTNIVLDPVFVDDLLLVQNEKIILALSESNVFELAEFEQMQGTHAMFRLKANNQWITVGIFEKRLLLATTNSQDNINDALSETVVSIGIKSQNL